ncbi:MAG: FMN-binding protein [Oscillospiraceae bacterium]|nr:FMN-binding protein [Oscillospiraceae bacterium]
MPKPKLDLKGILFPTLSLFVICLVISGALAGVNAVTKDPIAANEAKAADAAREEIFPGARFVDNGDYFTAMDQNGAPVGYCIDGEARGYGGPIKITVGINAQGNVVKVQVVNCDGETPGLGQKVKEESFLKQFVGFAFFLRGDAGGHGSIETPIDGIASATYSSRGVVNAVNQAQQIWSDQINAGGEAQ